jgi:hypothetical protein
MYYMDLCRYVAIVAIGGATGNSEAAFVETKRVWHKVGAAGRALFEPQEDFMGLRW